MAEFNAIVRLPPFRTKTEAEQYAAAEFSRSLVRVVSVVDEQLEAEERAGRNKKMRRRGDDL
jgi:hypothetical protein